MCLFALLSAFTAAHAAQNNVHTTGQALDIDGNQNPLRRLFPDIEVVRQI